jgi:hypothetical protein
MAAINSSDGTPAFMVRMLSEPGVPTPLSVPGALPPSPPADADAAWSGTKMDTGVCA